MEAGTTRTADLSTELANFIVLPASSVLAYQLYGGTLRRPAVCAASTSWDEMLTEVLESTVDETTARALTAMFNGLLFGQRADRQRAEK